MDTRLLEEMKNIGAMVTLVLEILDSGNLLLQPVPLLPDDLVNVQMAAEIMKVSTKTIERRVKAGIIDNKKILGLVYYSTNQLIAVAHTLEFNKAKK